MPKLYTHLQCIGLHIDTFPVKGHSYMGDVTALGMTKTPEWMGWTVWREMSGYLGLTNHAADITARVGIMKAAIEKAAASSKVKGNNASTLRVFMSPEFFFRGFTGAYPDLDQVHQVREELEAVVGDKKYTDWLFVFGSVLAKADLGNGKAEVYNIVFVMPGGGGGETRLVMKELKSGIDFLKGRGYQLNDPKLINLPVSDPTFNYLGKVVDEDVQHLAPAKESGEGRERQKGKYGGDGGGGIFDHENVTFGVEICLDHLVKRLKKSPPAIGDWKVQVQLIPSAGMHIKNESVVACRSGFAFNVDGGGPHTKLAKVTAASRTTVDAQLTDVPSAVTLPLIGLTGEFTSLFKDQTPSVVVYPKVDLPHRTKV